MIEFCTSHSTLQSNEPNDDGKWYYYSFRFEASILSTHLVLFYAMEPSENWIKIYVNLIQLMMHNGNKFNGKKGSIHLLFSFFLFLFLLYLFLKLISHCNLHLHFILYTCMKLLHQIKLMCTLSGWFWLHLLLALLWSSFIPISIWLVFISSKMFISLPPTRCAFVQQAQFMHESNSILDGRFLRTSSIEHRPCSFISKAISNANVYRWREYVPSADIEWRTNRERTRKRKERSLWTAWC